MNYRKVGEKYVINKNGVYLSLTEKDLIKMEEIIKDIRSGENKFYKEDSRK